ncbi:hypothetical protein [Embleya sp. NPDC059259]|uniref:hypothetical protein n=1 Tax=unclassified Embleya TaxID=2699296 RepID=UPI0036856474
MTLVRHVAAPATGTAGSGADPLHFDLSANPDPLRISPSSGSPVKGDLIVVATPAAEAPVECRSFTITLKVGPGEGDLCSSLSGVTGRISLAGWTANVNESARTLTFTPGPDAPTEIGAGGGVTFQAMGLPVNQRIGLSQVDISVSWRQSGTTDWQQHTTGLGVGKFPLGFHLRSFTAESQSVPHGGSVTLRWDASAATFLALYYDGKTYPVTGETSTTVSGLRQTTSFHLRAVAQEGSGSVERTLSLLVHVANPAHLSVGRVIVHGTLQAGRVSPAASTDTPLVFPQHLPATPESLLAVDGTGWQDSQWIRSALPVGAPSLFSHTTGQPEGSPSNPYVELLYQPLGTTDLVWSSFDGYSWTRVEEPVGPGIDPCMTLKYPFLWVAYRGGASGTEVLMRRMQLDGKWGEPEQFKPATSPFRPALVARSALMLYLVITESTDKPPKYWFHEMNSWSTVNRWLPGAPATGAPALALFRDKMVCVYPSHDHHQVVNETYVQTWAAGPKLPFGAKPAGPPSLAVHGDRLHCVYRDVSGRAQLMSYDGTAWTSASPVSDRIYTYDPALLSTGGRLWLF